ncbi:RNA 2',3'-cyclic phosphodiesterase [Candidatus Woesearchaeota archaeon]|nr:MAG: RNA 2',3'-cyclic phosphodiesterase [Candidatus Woesearchaeota archaeon]
MRLFVAVDVSKEVKDHVYEIQHQMTSGLAKVSWVPKSNLHLTLKFLGEVSDVLVDEVKKRLSLVKFEPFKLTLTHLGFFPSKEYVRVMWIGINPEHKMIELQQKVDAELLDLFPQEQKFVSHLTIGRVKFIKKKKEYMKIIESVKVKNIEFEVKGFKLMRSTLRRGSPQYDEIASY